MKFTHLLTYHTPLVPNTYRTPLALNTYRLISFVWFVIELVPPNVPALHLPLMEEVTPTLLAFSRVEKYCTSPTTGTVAWSPTWGRTLWILRGTARERNWCQRFITNNLHNANPDLPKKQQSQQYHIIPRPSPPGLGLDPIECIFIQQD